MGTCSSGKGRTGGGGAGGGSAGDVNAAFSGAVDRLKQPTVENAQRVKYDSPDGGREIVARRDYDTSSKQSYYEISVYKGSTRLYRQRFTGKWNNAKNRFVADVT